VIVQYFAELCREAFPMKQILNADGAASKSAFAELEGKVTLSLGRRTISRVRGK